MELHRATLKTLDSKRTSYYCPAPKRFGVSHNVVYYWIERKIIPARRLNHGSPYWITIDQQKSAELEEWVLESPRIVPR